MIRVTELMVLVRAELLRTAAIRGAHFANP
jgi:hypothetical protein